MFSFGKSKRVVNIVIDDYVIRMVENNGKDIASVKQSAEKLLPDRTIENGKIVDELLFFQFMKDVVNEWGIKNRDVRFYVPDELIIMREIQLTEKVKKEELRQYITMEIGHTIHFPFKNPVFDLYDTSKLEKENKVTIFAASEEEIIKYTEIFADSKLNPVAVDAKPLGIYRYFLMTDKQFNKDNVYLFFELNLTSSNISIFQNHLIELLRYQLLNVTKEDWQPDEEHNPIEWTFTNETLSIDGQIEDQLSELERIMDFYQFSMHQGAKSITHLIILGDNPYVEDVKQRMEDRFNLTISQLKNEQIGQQFISAIGLALKGGK